MFKEAIWSPHQESIQKRIEIMQVPQIIFVSINTWCVLRDEIGKIYCLDGLYSECETFFSLDYRHVDKKCNPSLINSNWIYRINPRQSQKGNPVKWICLLWKTISQKILKLWYLHFKFEFPAACSAGWIQIKIRSLFKAKERCRSPQGCGKNSEIPRSLLRG